MLQLSLSTILHLKRPLTRYAMKWFWNNYLTNQTNVKDPTVSPLQASLDQLKGLPPALIINGENDVLRDEEVHCFRYGLTYIV